MKETIIKKRKDGYFTIQFMNNNIPYMQDHGFWGGIPTGVEFIITEETPNGSFILVAGGYGALSNNKWGLDYNYGNGAIFVRINDLIESIKPQL